MASTIENAAKAKSVAARKGNNMERTCRNTELSIKDVGRKVTLLGWVSMGIGSFIAILSECIQAIPSLHRGASPLDVLIDVVGYSLFVFGYLIYVLIRYLRNKKKSKSKESE